MVVLELAVDIGCISIELVVINDDSERFFRSNCSITVERVEGGSHVRIQSKRGSGDINGHLSYGQSWWSNRGTVLVLVVEEEAGAAVGSSVVERPSPVLCCKVLLAATDCE